MGKECMKCGHKRESSDTCPEYECPNCGAIYAKVEAAIAKRESDDSDKIIKQLNSSPKKKDPGGPGQLPASILVAGISASIFYVVFPMVCLAIVFALIPVLTDIVVAMIEVPMFVFNLSPPTQDSFGYKVNIAQWFWASIIFVVTFMVAWNNRKPEKNNKLTQNIKTTFLVCIKNVFRKRRTVAGIATVLLGGFAYFYPLYAHLLLIRFIQDSSLRKALYHSIDYYSLALVAIGILILVNASRLSVRKKTKNSPKNV